MAFFHAFFVSLCNMGGAFFISLCNMGGGSIAPWMSLHIDHDGDEWQGSKSSNYVRERWIIYDSLQIWECHISSLTLIVFFNVTVDRPKLFKYCPQIFDLTHLNTWVADLSYRCPICLFTYFLLWDFSFGSHWTRLRIQLAFRPLLLVIVNHQTGHGLFRRWPLLDQHTSPVLSWGTHS